LKTKLVTVGICVKNGEKTILDALKSVIDQDFPKTEIEIIIVDDGSTDNTLKIIEDFASRTRVQLKIFSQSWRGIASARNVVLRHSQAKYIVWVDADMRLCKDFLKKQVEFMELHPMVAAAKGSYIMLKSKKVVALLENCRIFPMRRSLFSEPWGTGGAIFRVSALKEIGGFDERIKGAGEDMDVIIRLKKKGWLIGKTKAKFCEKYKETWRDLWKQYYWWGYGAHFIRHKHKNTVSVFARLPLVALLKGIFRFSTVFNYDRRLTYLLLPLQEFFKETGWLAGFMAGNFDGYGH